MSQVVGLHDVNDESGASMVSAVFALGLAAVVVVVVTQSLLGGLGVARRADRQEQATALATKIIEATRNAPYDNLVMNEGDLAGDPLVLTGNRFDPDGTGPLVSEPMVVATSGGAINPHLTTETAGGATFEVGRYVTWVDATTQGGVGQSYKRLTVVASWGSVGHKHSQRSTALIANARRGLPVPKFEFTPSTQSKSVAPGNQVLFAHTVRNIGIIDTYDLSATVPSGRTWAISFYEDLGVVGEWVSGVDRLLTDTNATGVADTGSIQTNGTMNLLAVWDLATDETAGTEAVPIVATSGAESAVSKTATDTLTVAAPTVPLELTIHNDPSPPTGTTTAKKNLSMNTDAASAATLYAYSTDYYTAQGGRFVEKKTTDGDEGSAQYMANWVYQLPQATTFEGDATLRIWVAQKDLSCDNTVSFKVYLRQKNSANAATGTELASATGSSAPAGSSPCNFRESLVTLPLNHTISQNKWIELKITVNESTGTGALFAYDTSAYSSWLRLPRVSS